MVRGGQKVYKFMIPLTITTLRKRLNARNKTVKGLRKTICNKNRTIDTLRDNLAAAKEAHKKLAISIYASPRK